MAKQSEKLEATEYLHNLLKSGDTVYTVLKHCSQSGMTREISLRVIIDNEPRCIDWHVATLLGNRIGKHDGIVVGGCGMDMGFHLVYNLSRTLFPGGYALRHTWL